MHILVQFSFLIFTESYDFTVAQLKHTHTKSRRYTMNMLTLNNKGGRGASPLSFT